MKKIIIAGIITITTIQANFSFGDMVEEMKEVAIHTSKDAKDSIENMTNKNNQQTKKSIENNNSVEKKNLENNNTKVKNKIIENNNTKIPNDLNKTIKN